MDPRILTFLLAMLPISEVRGALPFSMIFFKLNDLEAIFWSILGNISIVPLIFIFLNFLKSNVFQKISWLKFLSNLFFEKIQKNYGSKTFKNLLGLTLFVGIPLPLTGAWSGAIISFLLQIPFQLAFLAISLGVVLSSILVFFITKTGILLEKNFGIMAVLLFFLLISLILIFSKKKNET